MNIIENIFLSQKKIINNLPSFERGLNNDINWDFKLVIGIIGQRGVGKTTLMLQRLKKTKKGIYFSCDNIEIIEFGLYKLVYELYKEYNETIFYIDEIHKYPNWTQEIKNIVDSFAVKVIISGSSSIDIINDGYDLSRRLLIYNLNTLSFREFLDFKYQIKLPKISLEDVLQKHKIYSLEYFSCLKQNYLKEYLQNYEYFFRADVRNKEQYYKLLKNAIKKTIYEDISRIYSIESKNLLNIDKLLFLLSNISPSEMSYLKISQKLKIDPRTAENYCHILEKSGLIFVINKFDNITNTLLKDKKILLSNANLVSYYNSLFKDYINIGLLREVFFVESIKRTASGIFLHTKQDFLVEHKSKKYIFEIGGKNKNTPKSKNTFVVADDISISEGNKIPLWLFGLIE